MTHKQNAEALKEALGIARNLRTVSGPDTAYQSLLCAVSAIIKANEGFDIERTD